MIESWVGLGLAATLAGFVQGLTGFGFVLAFVPLAMTTLQARDTVVTALALGVPMSAIVCIETRINLRRSLDILSGAVLGTPIGALALALLPQVALRWVIVIVVAAASVVVIIPRPRPQGASAHAAQRVVRFLAGIVGGVVNGSTGMGGPAIAVLAAGQRWPKDQARGALALFNLVSYVIALLQVGIGGTVVQHLPIDGFLGLLVAAVVGGALGVYLQRVLSVAWFQKILIVVVWVGLAADLLRFHG